MDINRIMKTEQNMIYISEMRPVFNRAALFSDTTENYISPAEPNPYSEVQVRFRTKAKNIDRVFLVHDNERILMTVTEGDDEFDYFTCSIEVEQEQYSYYFEVQVGRINCVYDTRGVSKYPEETFFFRIIPGFKTPKWAKGAVMYQIYVDRFYNGDPTNDVLTNEYQYIGDKSVRVEDWNKHPASMGVREFYGGDLQGVLDKMDYLQDLGIDVIYFNPLFVSPSNHKYDIQDYDYIDPHIGKIVHDEGELLRPDQKENREATRYIDRVTNKENLEASNELFAQVVAEAHKRGMKVILDGVFNHCGSFNKWLDRECIYENAEGYEKGAYVSEDSPYNTFFKFREHQWPYNPHYDGWWGHDTLPKLNYEESPALFDYIMHVGRKWVSPPYNVDGWRLDVAADLGQSGEYNHYFWKEFRRNVKEANPNALILAEHYGDPTEWLKGDEWDTVMNYDAFMEPLTWFLTGVEKHSDEYRQDQLGNPDSFFGSMRHFMTRFHTQSLQVAMNELSNHDHSRFLTRTNRKVGRTAYLGPEAANEGVDKAIMRLAVMIQMTWPGAPTIYYGDEAGLCGWTDPDNRRAYPWGREDQDLIDFHKEIIRVHKDYQAMKTGSILFLHGQYQFISYGRFNEQDKFVIAINSGDQPVSVALPVWRLGLTEATRMARLINTSPEGFSLETAMYSVENGILRLNCPPKYGVVIKNLT